MILQLWIFKACETDACAANMTVGHGQIDSAANRVDV